MRLFDRRFWLLYLGTVLLVMFLMLFFHLLTMSAPADMALIAIGRLLLVIGMIGTVVAVLSLPLAALIWFAFMRATAGGMSLRMRAMVASVLMVIGAAVFLNLLFGMGVLDRFDHDAPALLDYGTIPAMIVAPLLAARLYRGGEMVAQPPVFLDWRPLLIVMLVSLSALIASAVLDLMRAGIPGLAWSTARMGQWEAVLMATRIPLRALTFAIPASVILTVAAAFFWRGRGSLGFVAATVTAISCFLAMVHVLTGYGVFLRNAILDSLPSLLILLAVGWVIARLLRVPAEPPQAPPSAQGEI
ncbi:MAG: hypothetical protein Q4G26_10235 [Paracoccus sp. (in: a-proteobacteria)]|nr:hypothetical protein [Paracoccus sp. (in: a-proteobacteria)]